MKKSDYVVVSISYQRFLVPIDKVQQVLDLVKAYSAYLLR
jgi:hypothetical protein